MEPLTPPDCDLRGLPFMPLDVVRLVDSDLAALATGDEFKAAVMLWCKSWLQVPAASLPDDDRVLAHLTGAGPRWKKLKAMALRGFVKCDDGRLYHSVIAEKAREAWKHRLSQRERAAKRWQKPDESGGTPAAMPRHKPRQCKGEGEGQYSDDKSSGAAVLEIDPDKAFWANAKAYLKPHAKGDPGALIGRWCRDFSKAAAASAISAAQVERAVDPVAYIEAIMRKPALRAVGDDHSW